MREWLMRFIAGKRVYWVSDKVASTFTDYSGTTAANGAALVLVETMESIGASEANYRIDGWTVSVRKEQRPTPPEQEDAPK